MTALADQSPPVPTGLPWLAPGAQALVALARPEGAAWSALRHDPGAVLLVARFAPPSTLPFPHGAILSPAPLRFARARLDAPPVGALDYTLPGPARALEAALLIARLSRALAARRDDCDPERAWCCGLLAPLGWLAQAVVAPHAVAECLADSHLGRSSAEALARDRLLCPARLGARLARLWGLPDWIRVPLTRIDLPLALPTPDRSLAVLHALTRLAVALAREHGMDLGLLPSANLSAEEALLGVRLAETRVELLLEGEPVPPVPEVQSPYSTALLPQLLDAAAAHRDLLQQGRVADLEAELDALHLALREQIGGDERRLRTRQMSALAELAAGAGHEINNPLAVISGQAQYLLGHAEWMAADAEGKARKALQTIIGQTRRIHSLLRDLMQFARPAPAHRVWLDLPTLLGGVAASMRELAEARRVRVEVACPGERLAVYVDGEQVRIALAHLLRNALEAAPADGWARLSLVPSADRIEVRVEDNGPGPAPEQLPHLFDPFYSGRSAGRGRGLGLPVAWRLAHNHGGEVTLAPRRPGEPTRFILALPVTWSADERQAA